MRRRKTGTVFGVWLAAAVIAVFSAFIGCGGGGEDDSSGGQSPATQGPATGIYRGQSAAGNNVLGLIFSDGRYYFLYSPPSNPNLISLINSGSGVSSNGDFSANNLLAVPLSSIGYTQGTIANGTFSASYTTNSNLNGTFSYLPSGGSAITTTYEPTSVTVPTLTQIAKEYTGAFSHYYPSGNNLYTWSPATNFTVSANGSISGTVDCFTEPVCMSAPCPAITCNVTGTINPRTDINAYDVSLSIGSTNGGSTPLDGTYNGVAYFDAGTGNLNIAGISPTTNRAIGFK
jgi:hypothetical protein